MFTVVYLHHNDSSQLRSIKITTLATYTHNHSTTTTTTITTTWYFYNNKINVVKITLSPHRIGT